MVFARVQAENTNKILHRHFNTTKNFNVKWNEIKLVKRLFAVLQFQRCALFMWICSHAFVLLHWTLMCTRCITWNCNNTKFAETIQQALPQLTKRMSCVCFVAPALSIYILCSKELCAITKKKRYSCVVAKHCMCFKSSDFSANRNICIMFAQESHIRKSSMGRFLSKAKKKNEIMRSLQNFSCVFNTIKFVQ